MEHRVVLEMIALPAPGAFDISVGALFAPLSSLPKLMLDA